MKDVILARTPNHLVEFEFGQFTISRRSDGKALALIGKSAVGAVAHFREAVKKTPAEQVALDMIDALTNSGVQWVPMYKSTALKRILDEGSHE